jgi:nitric oxide reductase subunit B
MGAAYFIIPDETGRELFSPALALIQLAGLVVVSVIALAGFHVNWWEGRKFLEIPRPLDYLVVVDVLLFIFNIGMTLYRSRRRTTTSLILFFGLFSAALLYLPGMIDTTNQTMDSYWRWWVVHLWVEGVWELILGGLLSYLLIKLTGVDREVIEKWLYVIVGLTFLSGILGTGHHYYFIGTPRYWLWIGGIFSALEPLAFLGMAVYAIAMVKRGGRQHPNTVALNWTVGCAIMSAVGAGFLGFAHTLPQVNLYTRHPRHRHARPSGLLGRLCHDRPGHDLVLLTPADGTQALRDWGRRVCLLDLEHWHGEYDRSICGGGRDPGVSRTPGRHGLPRCAK